MGDWTRTRGRCTAAATGRRRLLLVSACCLLSVLLAARLWLRGVAAQVAPVQPFATAIQIDPNRARVPELMVLEGIGRVRAEQIVLHRVRHGRFRRVEDLLEVDGIGQDTLRRLVPFLKGLGR